MRRSSLSFPCLEDEMVQTGILENCPSNPTDKVIIVAESKLLQEVLLKPIKQCDLLSGKGFELPGEYFEEKARGTKNKVLLMEMPEIHLGPEERTKACWSSPINKTWEVNGTKTEIGESNISNGQSSNSLLTLSKRLNNYFFNGFLDGNCIPFFCAGSQVGMVCPAVVIQLANYPNVFSITKESVTFAVDLNDVNKRNLALDQVLRDLRSKDVFIPLRGWRDECYEIKRKFSEPPLFKIERSASPLFGMRKYGVQINGYVNHSSFGLCIWFQKRSPTKPTWPNMMDNFVGGGLSEGISVLDTAIKEAGEEANVPSSLSANLKPAGSVSFFHGSERGIHPNTEFVFDLELPQDFVPHNNDGEVSGWQLVPVDQVVEVICSKDFKITSSPVVMDWLIRRGIVTVDNEPDLPEVVELIHLPLHHFYR